MTSRLQELYDKLKELSNEWSKYPFVLFNDFNGSREEYNAYMQKNENARKKWFSFYKKHKDEMNNLIIEENKKNGVYWDREDWIYDVIKTIPQHFELTGQERTEEFIKDLEKIHGCVVTNDGAGYSLEIFTPYKVYLYRFNRGYGDYPIVIHKGFIAPNGNTYRNKIFLAKSTKDMKDRYFESENC